MPGMTYDEQLIAEGKCPELVPVRSEDFGWGDGRCLAPIVPGGYACPGHTSAIEAWQAMSEPERAAAEYAADMADEMGSW
jgi:hypothetical protein